jgi:hypothetical protein
MRSVLLALAIVALAPQLGRADDTVYNVEKAIRVTANSDLRLNRLATVVRVERGTFFAPTGEISTQRTAYLAPPDKIKYEAKLNRGGQAETMILARNGLRGWKSGGGPAEDLSVIEIDSLEGDASLWSLITLLPLKQKGVTLKALPAEKLNGKPAVGILITRPEKSDATIYFDADTGLPVKLTAKVREGPLEMGREVDLADYRDFDGIKLPTRITVSRAGRKIEEWTVQSYRFPDRFEDKVFQKPK